MIYGCFFYVSCYYLLLQLLLPPLGTLKHQIHFQIQRFGFMHGWVDGCSKRANKGLFRYRESKLRLFRPFRLSVIHFLSFCSRFVFGPISLLLFFCPAHLIWERTQRFSIHPRETATTRFCQTTQDSRMQSPLATAEPAHRALRWPVEGAASVLPVVMGMEGWDRGGGPWRGVRKEGNGATTTKWV